MGRVQRFQTDSPVCEHKLFCQRYGKDDCFGIWGKPDQLENACRKLGGIPGDENFAYDLVMRFEALPRISLLLLFNEGDGDFPAYATVLFQKHAEYYLDPESLAMTSAYLAGKLKNMV